MSQLLFLYVNTQVHHFYDILQSNHVVVVNLENYHSLKKINETDINVKEFQLVKAFSKLNIKPC